MAAVAVWAVVVWEEESAEEEVLMRLAGGEVGSVVLVVIDVVVAKGWTKKVVLGTIEKGERRGRRGTMANIDL